MFQDFDIFRMMDVPGLMSLNSPITKASGNGITTWLTVLGFNATFPQDAFSLAPQGLYAHLGK
jgi:hypothetical protein